MPINVPGSGRLKGRNVRKGKALKPSGKVREAVYVALYELGKQLLDDTGSGGGWLAEMVSLEAAMLALRELEAKWREIYGAKAETIGKRWVASTTALQKEVFQKDMARALGVDFTTIFDGNVVADAVMQMSVEASHLIRTIPAKYFADIEKAVLASYQPSGLPEGRTLTEEIMHIGGVTRERAAIIARDQTSKIHTAITRARNEEVGIDEYIWRTARDSRVVGTPGGCCANRLGNGRYATGIGTGSRKSLFRRVCPATVLRWTGPRWPPMITTSSPAVWAGFLRPYTPR